MTANWYALHVKPHKERAVTELLRVPDSIPALSGLADNEPFDVFFPAVRVKPVNPRSATIRPYFPGYIFVWANLENLGPNALSWIPGAHGLVSLGAEPAIVPDDLIIVLRNRMEDIEAAGGLVFDELQPGDPVRIVSGPFSGYEAIFDGRLPGSERVHVLLAFLSDYPQRIKIEASNLEKDRRKQ